MGFTVAFSYVCITGSYPLLCSFLILNPCLLMDTLGALSYLVFQKSWTQLAIPVLRFSFPQAHISIFPFKYES